nr:hypothetical protein GCM10020063_040630 [Dactylosporangium thailandense]
MVAAMSDGGRRLTFWWTGMSRRTSAVVCALLTLAIVAAGLVGYAVTAVGSNTLQGTAIDDATARTVSLAALSCPQLSGPKLAGQLLANAGLAADGTAPSRPGDAPAGLTGGAFERWKPWPNANPRDRSATVYALAHFMCDLAGQVRLTGLAGDQWRLALAAYHSGLPAVGSARGIPEAAKGYVGTVEGYTAWYARQSAFGGSERPPSPSTSARLGVPPAAGSPAAVPDKYLAAIGAAGSVCPQVTPARIAAQLMAASGFDPNHRSADGAMGIAGFRNDVWSYYGPPSGSPWDPELAVWVLGTAMCDLLGTFTRVGGDPYDSALAAFRTGTTAVRQAGGVPRVPGVADFVSRVDGFADFYHTVGAFGPPSPMPSTAPPTPSPSPVATTGRPPASRATPTPTPTSMPTVTKPAPTRYKIINVLSGKVVAVAGSSRKEGDVVVQAADGTDASRLWILIADTGGTVRIRSVFNGFDLSPQNASTSEFAFITQVRDTSTPATRWQLVDTGGGVYKVKNAGSGFLLALQRMVTTDGTKLFQHHDNGTADHLWRIVPAG